MERLCGAGVQQMGPQQDAIQSPTCLAAAHAEADCGLVLGPACSML